MKHLADSHGDHQRSMIEMDCGAALVDTLIRALPVIDVKSSLPQPWDSFTVHALARACRISFSFRVVE